MTWRLPGVATAIAVATLLALYDLLAGPDIVMAGLIVVGPCLAATSGGRRAVLGVGGYIMLLILLVSGPDGIWWTQQLLMYLLAAAAVTVVSAAIAQQRISQEQNIQLAQTRELELSLAIEETRRIAEYSRSLLEASADPLVTISPAGAITDVNAATTKVTGIDRRALIGTDFSDYFTDRIQAQRVYQQVLVGESVTNYPLTIRRPDGQLTDVLYNASVYRDNSGAVLGVFAAARDVTAQKQAEANFQGLLEGAPDAIVVVDGEGLIQIVNRETELLFGYPRDEIIGEPIEILVPSRLRAQHVDLRSRYLADPNRRPMGIGLELNGRRRDGSEFPAEVSLAPVQTAQGTQVSASVRDVTYQHQVRADIVQANQAKSEFLSRMSHELRTPLNAVLGFAQLLEKDNLEIDRKEAVRHILHGGRHLLGLIDDVLDITKIETDRLDVSIEQVLISELLIETMKMTDPALDGMEVTLRYEPAEDANRQVLADRRRLRQVLLNLLSNAVKYNRRGGAVDVSCRAIDGRALEILITDTGYGITEENLPRLFTPFDRLGAEASGIEGTGVGLALSQRLMTNMAGTLRAESRLDVGSTFIVSIPLTTNLDRMTPKARPPAPTVDIDPARPTSMLVYVEDNNSNVELMATMLALRPNWQMSVARDGAAGLALIRTELPDLVLLDLHLPVMDGSQLLHELRHDPTAKQPHVVMLSADANPHQKKRLLAAGANDYFTKPLDVDKILDLLDARDQFAAHLLDVDRADPTRGD